MVFKVACLFLSADRCIVMAGIFVCLRIYISRFQLGVCDIHWCHNLPPFFQLKLIVKCLNSQLSRVTEERDKLRNDINEFKRAKSDGAGDEATSQTLLKVIDVIFFNNTFNW